MAAGLLVLAVLLPSTNASAQSIGIGGGVGFPFTTYVEDELDREFRVVPEPGYYPVLQERTNSLAGMHLHLSVVLDDREFLWIFHDLEIRVDYLQYSWSDAVATHTGCEPIPVFDNDFDAATADFESLPEACCFTEMVDGSPVERCLDDFDYETRTDISELELPELQIFNVNVGGRYNLLEQMDWEIYLGLGGGFTAATFADPGAEFYFGGNLAGSAGFVYNLGLIGIEVEGRVTGILTEAPDTVQTRLNSDAQTGGWVGASILETFVYADLQAGLRLNFDAL